MTPLARPLAAVGGCGRWVEDGPRGHIGAMTLPLRHPGLAGPRVPRVAVPSRTHDRTTLVLIGATAWTLLLLIGLLLTFG